MRNVDVIPNRVCAKGYCAGQPACPEGECRRTTHATRKCERCKGTGTVYVGQPDYTGCGYPLACGKCDG